MASNQKLSLRVRIGYGAGEFSSSLFWIAIGFWLLNYLTDEVGLSAGLAGVAVLVGKLWDAVTDPAVGFLSDRTKSRWGRRRPWMLYSAVPFGLAFLLMFTNPGLEGQTAKFIWSAVAFMILCTAYTCANVPYNALLPDLTQDFDERSSLSAYKSAFAVTATLVGAGIAAPIIGIADSRTAGFIVMGGVFGVLVSVSVLMPFFLVREPENRVAAPAGNLLSSNRDALRNRPFRLLLGTWTANTIAVVIVTGTLVYYFKYIYGDEGLITFASLIMLVASMAFLPVSVKLSERIGKRMTYIAGMSLFSGVLLVFFFIGHRFGMPMVYGLMFVAGIGLSTHYVMPWALVPDAIEQDYANNGVRREGVFYGLWTFMIKVGQALAGMLIGVILGAFGYVPDVTQSPGSLLGIRLLIGPFTVLFLLVGIVFLWRYPIDRAAYDEIRAKIELLESERNA